MNYARIDSGRVAEIITLPDAVTPSDCFAGVIASSLVPCDGAVAVGMTWNGAAFAAMESPEPTRAERREALAARITALEAQTVRPLGDLLLYRTDGKVAEAEVEEARIITLRRQISALRAELLAL